MSPDLTEICIIANLQSTGPLYIGDTEQGLFDTVSGSMLAARLIITAGMGNSVSPANRLHGPVPIPELELDKEYICYFFLTEMEQQPLPNNSFSTGRGTYITCVVIPEDEKESLRPYERIIETILKEHILDINFSSTITGQIPSELLKNIKDRLKLVKTQIQDVFALAPLFEGSSLFDVGLFGSLPENLSGLAKKLILKPKGTKFESIEDKKSLHIFENAGLVVIEERQDGKWVIPI